MTPVIAAIGVAAAVAEEDDKPVLNDAFLELLSMLVMRRSDRVDMIGKGALGP